MINQLIFFFWLGEYTINQSVGKSIVTLHSLPAFTNQERERERERASKVHKGAIVVQWFVDSVRVPNAD